MDRVGQLIEFAEGDFTAFGGFGIAIAALLILVLWLIAPSRRAKLKTPTTFLMIHLVLILTLVLFETSGSEHLGNFGALAGGGIRLTALTALLLSLARSLYLHLAHLFFEKRIRRHSLPGIFRDIVQVVLYVGVLLIVLSAAGVEPGSLLTTSALLTAVIGLSLQDTLGNVFAGLAIQAQRPFDVGDWIEFGDDENLRTGEVLEINWRATRLQTIEDVEIVVPNNVLSRSALLNFSKPTPLFRRSVCVVAPHDTPPARVRRCLLGPITEVDGVASDPVPSVHVNDFTERGVEYEIRFYLSSFPERQVVAGRVLERAWYAMRRASLGVPAPQRRVTVVEQSEASAERASQARILEIERFLHTISFLAALPDQLLHELAIHTESRLYAPGELVIHEGEYGEALFIVERGRLEVLVACSEGQRHVATLAANDFFGEMSLMTGASRRATVKAQTEVVTLVVSKESMQPLLESAPDVMEEISRVLAERQLQLEQRSSLPAPLAKGDIENRSNELLERIRNFFSL